jgi:hypothetical protein
MARTSLRLATDTKAARMATAEFSARTWRSHSDVRGSARCAVCGSWVETVRRIVGDQLESWSDALVGALFEHIEAKHGK